MADDRPTLDVVIVDYRAGALLDACLASLDAHRPRRSALGTVALIDNDAEGAARELPASDLPIRYVKNDRNAGFAAACNQGAALGRARYILFLNPDTRVADGSLDIPVDFLESTEAGGAAIVGIQLLGDDARPTPSAFAFPRPRHFWNRALGLSRLSARFFADGTYTGFGFDRTRRVDQVIGAFFLVRRSVFESLGGFDERFFVYFEEMDLSLRARRAGYESIFLADAFAYHSGAGTTDRIRARRLFYSLRSRLQYAAKHFGAIGVASTALVTLCAEPAARLAFALVRRRWAEAREAFTGYGMLAAWLARTGQDR